MKTRLGRIVPGYGIVVSNIRYCEKGDSVFKDDSAAIPALYAGWGCTCPRSCMRWLRANFTASLAETSPGPDTGVEEGGGREKL